MLLYHTLSALMQQSMVQPNMKTLGALQLNLSHLIYSKLQMKCWSSSRAPTNSSEQLCTSRRPGCENDSLTCTMFGSCQGSNTCHNDHTLHIQQWDGEEEDWRHSIVQQLVIQLLWVIERCQESGNTIVGFKWYNSHCIKLTIVNVNIVMQLPWHPSWISSGSEKNVLFLSLQNRVNCVWKIPR